jgi:hypothetical protein
MRARPQREAAPAESSRAGRSNSAAVPAGAALDTPTRRLLHARALLPRAPGGARAPMRLALTSDVHADTWKRSAPLSWKRCPPADVLLVAGDLHDDQDGSAEELRKAAQVLLICRCETVCTSAPSERTTLTRDGALARTRAAVSAGRVDRRQPRGVLSWRGFGRQRAARGRCVAMSVILCRGVCGRATRAAAAAVQPLAAAAAMQQHWPPPDAKGEPREAVPGRRGTSRSRALLRCLHTGAAARCCTLHCSCAAALTCVVLRARRHLAARKRGVLGRTQDAAARRRAVRRLLRLVGL